MNCMHCNFAHSTRAFQNGSFFTRVKLAIFSLDAKNGQQRINTTPISFQSARTNPWSIKPGLKNTEMVPYRLTDVIDSNLVYICEGEKDADNLAEKFDIAATALQGGNWNDVYQQYFKGKHVRIIPDNDEAGKNKAQKIAQGVFPPPQSLHITLDKTMTHGTSPECTKTTSFSLSSVRVLEVLLFAVRPRKKRGKLEKDGSKKQCPLRREQDSKACWARQLPWDRGIWTWGQLDTTSCKGGEKGWTQKAFLRFSATEMSKSNISSFILWKD